MRVAVYCTADSNYLEYAVVALKSIQRFEDCDVFVLSGKLSSLERSFLRQNKIGVVSTNKHLVFKNSKWPNITFLQLAGPEIFWYMGYEYSMGIDADVFCDKPLDLRSIFAETEFYAGIVNQVPRRSNFRHPKYIQAKYGISDKEMEGENTNGGAIYWNNKAASDFKLWDTAVLMWEENEFVAVDQSLFALVSVGLPFHKLPRGYNFRVGNKNDLSEGCDDIRLYHFTGVKPWDGPVKYGYKWHKFRESLTF